MYQVSEVMNGSVLTISKDVTVETAIRCLVDNHISGLPVVDEHEHLVGIITEFQLLETLFTPEIKGMRVGEVMTKDVLTVASSAMLSDAASMMVSHRIRRLPVVDGDKIVGIVSRRDLLKYTLEDDGKLADYLNEVKAFA